MRTITNPETANRMMTAIQNLAAQETNPAKVEAFAVVMNTLNRRKAVAESLDEEYRATAILSEVKSLASVFGEGTPETGVIYAVLAVIYGEFAAEL